ncbi:hypothetical protein STENM223S_07485 [Streptomyces tendae]
MIELCVNVHMNTPVTRNGTKSSTPWLVFISMPKMR